jgi:hypothetical protein
VRRLTVPLLVLAAWSAGCHSSSEPPPPAFPAAPTPSPSAVNALADLPQDVAGPPGTRSFWDLDRDFALNDGGDDQFDRAVQLHVGLPSPAPTPDSLPGDLGADVIPFPLDQRAAELSFTTPVVARGAAQLAAVVASANATLGHEVVLSGSFGLPANGGALASTRLSQAIDLTGATGALTLGWTHHGVPLDGTIPASPAVDAWRVTVRDASSGNVLVPAWSGNAVASGPVAPVDVSAAAGRRVTLDFELLGSPRGFVAVDQVSLKGGSTEYVANGDFEGASLSPWTVTGPDQPCQVVSGKRTLHGLQVERWVYARPDLRWARFVDVFKNPGAAAITTEADYLNELGALSDAVIQSSGSGKALSSWDGSGVIPARRDLAIVSGTSTLASAWRSVSQLGLGDGSSLAWTRFPLSVPAGGTKTIVQFVVLAESRTGDTATTTAARSSLADSEAAAIVSGFWSTTTFREGMTAEQVAGIVNW